MSQVQTGVLAHDQAVQSSEGMLQAAIAAATTQAMVNAACITHYRNCLKSAVANKCGAEPFLVALKSLGMNS